MLQLSKGTIVKMEKEHESKFTETMDRHAGQTSCHHEKMPQMREKDGIYKQRKVQSQCQWPSHRRLADLPVRTMRDLLEYDRMGKGGGRPPGEKGV